jgi:hypothetical protein
MIDSFSNDQQQQLNTSCQIYISKFIQSFYNYTDLSSKQQGNVQTIEIYYHHSVHGEPLLLVRSPVLLAWLIKGCVVCGLPVIDESIGESPWSWSSNSG